MNVPEPSDTLPNLSQVLRVIGNDSRIFILRYLLAQQIPVDFSDIQKALQKSFSGTGNLTYHLQQLHKTKSIQETDDGYTLTPFGEKLIRQLAKMDEIVWDESPILIRTSKYSLEQFDERVIEQSLRIESNMPADLAHEIAAEARKRLTKAKITYLTSPLVREYINAILIEHQMEDYRHQLTRLGLPPFDVKQMLSGTLYGSPEELRANVGKTILEQYLLLIQLQQKYADFLLAGQFVLSDLSHFGICPLELILSGVNMNDILEKYASSCHAPDDPVHSPLSDESVFTLPFARFLVFFQHLLEEIDGFFPQGIVIIRFDEFLERFLEAYTTANLETLMWYGFAERPSHQNQSLPSITLGVSFQANDLDLLPLFNIYTLPPPIPLPRSRNSATPPRLPHLSISIDKEGLKPLFRATKAQDLPPRYQQLLILLAKKQAEVNQFTQRGQPQSEHIFSNLQIPVLSPPLTSFRPSMIWGKISINLWALFLKAKENEEAFFEELQKALFTVFDFFDRKYYLLSKNLPNFPQWGRLSMILFESGNIFTDTHDLSHYRAIPSLICAISFFGLEEIILQKTKFLIKDLPNNRKLAVRIMDFMATLIHKQNKTFSEANNVRFVLSEAHPQLKISFPTNQEHLPQTTRFSDRLSSNHPGFFYGFHSSPIPLTDSHIADIYADLTAGVFHELRLPFTLPPSPSPGSSDFDRILRYLQTFLPTKVACFTFNTPNLEIWKP
ncbi:MAG: DUF7347 domain-containing protein [Promethearchaeota archaeon]